MPYKSILLLNFYIYSIKYIEFLQNVWQKKLNITKQARYVFWLETCFFWIILNLRASL